MQSKNREFRALLTANLVLFCINGILYVTDLMDNRSQRGGSDSFIVQKDRLPEINRRDSRVESLSSLGRESASGAIVPVPIIVTELTDHVPDLLTDELELSDRICQALEISGSQRTQVNTHLKEVFHSVASMEKERARVSDESDDEHAAVVIEPLLLGSERQRLATAIEKVIGKNKSHCLMEILKQDRFFRDEPSLRRIWVEITEDGDEENFALKLERKGEPPTSASHVLSPARSGRSDREIGALFVGRYEHLIPNVEGWIDYLKLRLQSGTAGNIEDGETE